MKKIIKQSNKGVQGARIKLSPEKEDSMLVTDNLIQRGKVIAVGKDSICKVGDIVIVSDWLVEKVTIGEELSFYVPDSAILEIL